MQTESLKATEAECAEGRAPRVSLADIEANIGTTWYFTAGEAVHALASFGWLGGVYDSNDAPASLGVLTICLLVTRNGFMIIGKSAPASPTTSTPNSAASSLTRTPCASCGRSWAMRCARSWRSDR